MKKLTFDSVIKGGKYAGKTVSEVVDIKGGIISMIKEKYEFEDDVLEAAHIKRIIRDEKFILDVEKECVFENCKVLPKETTPLRQILAELDIKKNNYEENTDKCDNYGNKDSVEDDFDEYDE